jgi:hypothetical protein
MLPDLGITLETQASLYDFFLIHVQMWPDGHAHTPSSLYYRCLFTKSKALLTTRKFAIQRIVSIWSFNKVPIDMKIQKYYTTTYAKCSVNHMWILKNSKKKTFSKSKSTKLLLN